MECRIVKRDSFTVMGIAAAVHAGTESAELFGRIWKDFESRLDEIGPHSSDSAFYGIRFPAADEGATEYLAGMAAEGHVTPPDGVAIRQVPAGEFALFECSVGTIGETYGRIFREWLPASSHDLDTRAPVFEEYPPEGEEERPVLIHIPLTARG